eukprot:365898-Chlamydomonas_euryale.AAC.15
MQIVSLYTVATAVPQASKSLLCSLYKCHLGRALPGSVQVVTSPGLIFSSHIRPLEWRGTGKRWRLAHTLHALVKTYWVYHRINSQLRYRVMLCNTNAMASRQARSTGLLQSPP